MTRWMVARVEVEEAGEDFQGWGHREGGSPRWIRTDLEGTLAVMADRAVTKTSSPGLGAWVRAAEVEEGTRVVVEEGADVMEGMEVVVGEDTEVPGGTTIVIAITLGGVMTAEGEEAITEVAGAVNVSVGELGVAVVGAEAAAGDTKLALVYTFLNSIATAFVFEFRPYSIVVQRDAYSTTTAGTRGITQLGKP